MCGRFTLRTPAAILADYFGLDPLPGLAPRYNIAPSQPVAVVRASADGRAMSALRWGLVPYWADDPSIGYRMINARAETLASKPAYREPFARRRCLIPADGFYEWQRLDGGLKQPFFISLSDNGPFAFAGLWDRWRDRESGVEIESCALITTAPNDVVRPIHDRMPVILERPQLDTWLDDDAEPVELQPLLRPPASDRLRAVPVSVHVNRPDNDDSRCIEPVSAVPRPRRLFE